MLTKSPEKTTITTTTHDDHHNNNFHTIEPTFLFAWHLSPPPSIAKGLDSTRGTLRCENCSPCCHTRWCVFLEILRPQLCQSLHNFSVRHHIRWMWYLTDGSSSIGMTKSFTSIFLHFIWYSSCIKLMPEVSAWFGKIGSCVPNCSYFAI
jgi:hypothetical protein